jgi:uncharacterized phiE125 gp8 family phage protein
MISRLITPPATLPVTLAQAKANMRVTTDVEDDLIMGYVASALAYAEKYCGRIFASQVWEVTLDAFPAAEIMLSPGPVLSVDSVIYTDVNGAPQTIAPTSYYADLTQADGWVIPIDTWPSPMATANAIAVRYTAGTASGTPPDVIQAILLLSTFYYEKRSAEAAPVGVDLLLWQHARMYA